MTLPALFRTLKVEGGPVAFFGIIALHQDEMGHKLAHGVEALFDGFDRHRVNELLDIDRASSLRP